MRILLLGELSGLHQELYRGLVAAGNEVVVGHSRLSYESYESDISFYRPADGAHGMLNTGREILSQLFHAPKLTGFDIVQIITPKFFNWKIYAPMMHFIKKFNSRIVIINTSCTSDYHREFTKLRYSPCAECKLHDLKAADCIYDQPAERALEHFVFGIADAVVATHFEYQWALKETPFADKLVAIAPPIDTRLYRETPMPPGDQMRVWYGETRHGFKGGRFVLSAIELLKKSRFASRFEIITTGRLGFDHYLEHLDQVHVVIDQASSYSPGMNALYALAKGRVTLSGAEPEAMACWGVPAADNPIINITPDPEQIFDKLVSLSENRAAVVAAGHRSREYVERYHSADVIAGQYLALYRKLLDGKFSGGLRETVTTGSETCLA